MTASNTRATSPSPLLSLARKRTRAEEVTERLREAILRGVFEPGQPVSEEQLAASLGVSRGPVHEAVVQLQHEGLVLIRPNRRAVVARLTRRDLEEVYSLRLAMEQLAVQYAIHHARTEDFDMMEAVIRSLEDAAVRGINEQEAADFDINFHDLVYRAAQHERLYQVWSKLKSQVYVFLLSRNIANPDFREQGIIRGHTAILDALRARDEKRAVELTEQHLRAAYLRILAAFPEHEEAGEADSALSIDESAPPHVRRPPVGPLQARRKT